MKTTNLIFLFFSCFFVANAQEISAAFQVDATNQGLLLPRVANTSVVIAPVNGLMIYDLSTHCIKSFENGAWTDCLSSNSNVSNPIIVDCISNGFSGTFTSGVAMTGGNTFSVTITNTSFFTATIPLQPSDLVLSGVSGITVNAVSATSITLQAGESQLITYQLSGTPASEGILIGNWTKQTLNCSQSTSINSSPLVIPPTITLHQNSFHFIGSIYDEDYFPYTSPTTTANINTQAADGLNESLTINIQGTITTTGIQVKIPVIATSSGTLPAFTSTTQIPANMTEDGISRTVSLSWASQNYTSNTTSIVATLAAIDGTLNIKKLDINAGVGQDALGVVIGEITYPYNNALASTTFTIRAIAGIPDKMFGVPDNNNNRGSHMMFYLPVLAEDGNIWLNNNLGAHYAYIFHPNFNLAQQAISEVDHLAYGSLFQWGRKPDGHELVNWVSGNSPSAVRGTSSTNSNTPTDSNFITEPNHPYDWRVSQANNLWASENSTNNPCPVGFRVPTITELDNLISAANITNSSSGYHSILKLTKPGIRNHYAEFSNYSIEGVYSSSSVSTIYALSRTIDSGGLINTSGYRAIGTTVRCRKN